jgi:hypothetical protein
MHSNANDLGRDDGQTSSAVAEGTAFARHGGNHIARLEGEGEADAEKVDGRVYLVDRMGLARSNAKVKELRRKRHAEGRLSFPWAA